ncbi:SCO5389 family protein [Actinoallomurus vinaceus]|uniref:SCO5389 family protein n=1 Tax=Actinoallomurus vinaceus TaxID=1080074 RepID=A0ABP8URE4_9ACTN
MSLTVSPELIERARRDDVDDAAFVDCVRTSLPYAWQVVSGLIDELRTDGADFAANEVPPPDETARGQLLRMLASDAMRGALERHFGVRLAFQNCHRVAVFRPGAHEAYREFVTPRAQILNQRPELVDC